MLPQFTDYVVDLKALRDQYELIPAEVRRPEIVMADEYHDDEAFDMEIQSIVTHLKDRQFAGEMLSRYTQDIIDSFEEALDEYPRELEKSIKIATTYARCISDLGECLWRFFIDNELYNTDNKLIGEYQNFVQGRWLVIRRDRTVHK